MKKGVLNSFASNGFAYRRLLHQTQNKILKVF